MNRFVVMASLGAALAFGSSIAMAQEIETFDDPDTLQSGGGAFYFDGLYDSWGSTNATETNNPTSYQITVTNNGGYGSAYKSIYGDDNPPPGQSHGVIDISGSNTLQFDASILSGDSGFYVDLQDGEGDEVKYFWGYGLDGNAADDQGGLSAGETVTQGAGTDELILDAPLTDWSSITEHNPTVSNPATPGGFDFSSIVSFNIEDDPGSNGNYSITLNDLSAVTTPEPTTIALGAISLGLLAARRRRA